MTEFEQIQAAKAGNPDAFLALLKAHDRKVMSVIYRFSGDLYDREDLYQEIFLHAFESIKRFRGDACIGTWLYRVAFNRCLSFMKERPVVAEVIDAPFDPESMERRAIMRSVQAAMKRLKGSQRIAFHLYYVEEWRLSEIAAILECREGTVKSHLNRARDKVKKDREVVQWQMRPV